MTKRSKTKAPKTFTQHPEPDRGSVEWVIWAAWADRISFEFIEAETGLREADVIDIMRRHQSPSTYRRWRKRVADRTTKHRYRFVHRRRESRTYDWKQDEVGSSSEV